MKAMNACVIDDEEPIDPPEMELTPEEEEQAAWEWFFEEAYPHLAPPKGDTNDLPPARNSLRLEEDFEALCDAALECSN